MGRPTCIVRKYLQSYLDEYAFRYNHRNDEQPMFRTMLRRVSLTAAQPKRTIAAAGPS